MKHPILCHFLEDTFPSVFHHYHYLLILAIHGTNLPINLFINSLTNDLIHQEGLLIPLSPHIGWQPSALYDGGLSVSSIRVSGTPRHTAVMSPSQAQGALTGIYSEIRSVAI